MNFIDARLKIRRFIKNNRRKVMIVVVAIAIIVAINYVLKNMPEEETPRTTYEPNIAVMDSSEVPEKWQDEIKNRIDTFITYCNEKNYQSAYDMISDDCKNALFPIIDDFIEYDDGVYATISGREEPCYIPDDAWIILKEYMDQRLVCDTLFYNRSGRPLNTMYISRMMKKYCSLAGIRNYSAQAVRNSCAFNMFAYGASDGQTARQMGRTEQQIRRYRGSLYRENLQKQASALVKIHIEKP